MVGWKGNSVVRKRLRWRESGDGDCSSSIEELRGVFTDHHVVIYINVILYKLQAQD
jgi:hypothetical protein